jgi:RNA polymerase sigma-70 factor (family 1)
MNHDNLVARIKRDDHEAFKLIFNDLYASLLAYVITFTHDQAEAKDIVQNSFIILWDKRKGLSENSSLKSYLHTVAYNLCVSRYRKNQFKSKVFDELKLIALNNRIADDTSVQEERTKKLLVLIENLPSKCKQIVLLNKRDGIKYKDIAVMLNISTKTVESQMRIAFKKIRKGFKNDALYLFVSLKKLMRQHQS